jgi:predicted nucleotide-binding protein
LRPYREGRPIVVGGRTIPADDIERIRINKSDEDAATLLPRVIAERRRSNVFTTIGNDWYIADSGTDVTDEFIQGPPGYARPQATEASMNDYPDSKKVFVVHGRNSRARDAMFTFLRSVHLQPIEFNEAINATGKGSPYIGDILSVAFQQAQAVVVLFTPDDEARLRNEYCQPSDPQHEKELTGQARPNVIFEAGMAIGRDENRTVLVELGSLRPFSDIGGRHVIRINGSSQRRQELAQRLQTAGCDVNMTGTDWHTAGDFDSALTPP